MMRRPLLVPLAAFLALGSAAHAGTITPVSQSRQVTGSGSATDSATSSTDSDSDAAADFAPFSGNASALVSLSGALGAGSAYQTSQIGPVSISAVGGHAANGEGWEELGFGDGAGRSLFDVTFTLDAASDYTLTGSLEAFDNGDTQISFSGPGGVIYSDWINGFIQPVSLTGTLAAGSYTLLIDTQGSAYGDLYFYDYSSGYFDITLQLPAVEAPAIASGERPAIFPNPFRNATRISFAAPDAGAPLLRVFDAAGRLVRDLTAEAGTGSLRWDGRDSAGRAVPAGVYFVRIPGPDGPETVRVTRIR